MSSSLFILLLMDIWVVSNVEWLWIKMLWVFLYLCFGGHHALIFLEYVSMSGIAGSYSSPSSRTCGGRVSDRVCLLIGPTLPLQPGQIPLVPNLLCWRYLSDKAGRAPIRSQETWILVPNLSVNSYGGKSLNSSEPLPYLFKCLWDYWEVNNIDPDNYADEKRQKTMFYSCSAWWLWVHLFINSIIPAALHPSCPY